MPPTFSIIIPVMNGRTSLELVLRCLAAQTLPREQFECLVVDDGSTDGTTAFLRRYQAPFNLRAFFHPTNLGRSQARNTACKQASGEFLIFLDADMLTEPEWLAHYQSALTAGLLDVASGGRHHLNLGAKSGDAAVALAQLTGLNLAEDLSPQFDKIRQAAAPAMYPSLAMQRFEAQLPDACQADSESMICAYSVITSNVAVRRALFERVFGFDLSMRRGEDSDLGVRLWEAGARFGFASDAKAYHLYHSGQGDRNNTWMERLAFVYHHPYLLAFLIPLWFACHDQPEPNPPSEIFNSLTTLVAAKDHFADLDLVTAYNETYRQPLPAECVYDRAFMTDYLCEHSGIAPDELSGYLDQGLAQGLVVQRRAGVLYFDIQHTINWLRRSSRFQQYEFKHARYLRPQQDFFWSFPDASSARKPIKAATDLRKPVALQCRGLYQVEIPLALVDGTLNLALPMEHRSQCGVEISRCVPENLLSYANPERTLIRDFPLRQAAQSGDTLHISYEFSCQLREDWTGEKPLVPEPASKLATFLRPTYPATQLPKAQAILEKIFPEMVSDGYAAARKIYFWVLTNTVYLQNALTDTAILDTRFGSCIQQTRLFINLCRLLRIPAREQCGVIFARPCPSDDDEKVQMDNRGYTLLNHTWAEFYTPTRGWTPVDLATSMGERLLTAVNVDDVALRDEVLRDSQKYDEYYFGHLDSFRLYSSAEVNKVITCPMAANLEADLLKQLIFNTHHHITCNFSFIEQ